MIATALNKTQKSAGQLANPIRLAKPHSFPGDQLAAYAERYGSSKDKIGRVLLIYAA